MQPHPLSPEQTLEALRTTAQGLAQTEAARRLAEFGINRITTLAGEFLLRRLLKEFTHFFALILWLAAGLAFFADRQAGGTGMAILGWAIVGVILINGGFSFFQNYRAERMAQALRDLLPVRVLVWRDGRLALCDAAVLVPGDVVELRAGDGIPADCRLLAGQDLRVSLAALTGESAPKSRQVEAVEPATVALQAPNLLLAGGTMIAGEATAVVYATGMQTEFGRIAGLTQATRPARSPLQLEIARISRWLASLALLLGAVFFAAGHAMGLPWWNSGLFAIGIIVANVPEGLLPTVTLALSMATQRMARRNALVRHLPAVETLGAATVICTDKTGTLTTNRMAVRQVFFDGQWTVIGAGIVDPDSPSLPRLYEIAWFCHELRRIQDAAGLSWRGDPLEVALVEMAAARLAPAPDYPREGLIPFDSERRRQSSRHRTPEGSILYCKGALEVVLPRCTQVLERGVCRPLTETLRQQWLAAETAMAGQGLRILACAYRRLQAGTAPADPEQELVLAGLVGLNDPPRPDVAQAVAKCRTAGIQVIMITGDHPRTAEAIAREVGLVRTPQPRIILGDALRRYSASQLQLALDAPEVIFARMGADQKLKVVQALKRKGHAVAVTGDGVNDAPALRAADIGIAMGRSGTDVAKEAADIILLDDHFATIVSAVEEGRAVYDNIRRFISYILTSNIPELVPYVAYALLAIPLPLTILQILAVDLGTDLLPALGLGVEPPLPGIMERPPHPRGQRLLDMPLLLRAYGFLGLWEAAAAMAAYAYVLWQGGWAGGTLAPQDPLYLQATTACLSAIVVTQIVNVLLCKHPDRPLWRGGLLDNHLIFAGIALEILFILAVDYTPWGNWLLATHPIGWPVWVIMLVFALAMLLGEELRKAVVAFRREKAGPRRPFAGRMRDDSSPPR